MNEMVTLEKQNPQSGQAVVEYILLLVVSIALILGLANQLSKPFSAWMKNYMGEYVECLLDMGELPTIGGSSDSGECNSRFKAFTVENGRPRDPSKSSGSDEQGLASRQRVRSSSEVASASGASGPSSGGRSRGFQIGKSRGADGPHSELGDKQMSEPLPDSQYFNMHSSSSSSIGSLSGGNKSQNGMIIPLMRAKTKERGGKSVNVSIDSDLGSQSQAKKLVITPPERKPAAEEQDQPWGFGQYIKFALILLIIIALILFLGGQILQISKSMEK